MERITPKSFISNFSPLTPSKTKSLKQNNSTWTSNQMALVAGSIISAIGLGTLAYQQLKSPVISSEGSWVLKGIIGVASIATVLKITAKSDEIKKVSSDMEVYSHIASYVTALESNEIPQEIDCEKIKKWGDSFKRIDSSKNVDQNNDGYYTSLKRLIEGKWHNNKSFGELLYLFHSMTLVIDHDDTVNLAAACKEYLKSNSNLLTPYLHRIIETTLKDENPDIQQKIKLCPSLLSNSPDSTTTNNPSKNLLVRFQGKQYNVSLSREKEMIDTLDFTKELQKSTPANADYTKIDKFINMLIHFYKNDFELAKKESNTFEIDYHENIYNKLTTFFALTLNNIDLFGQSLKKFHSLTLLMDYEKAINIAAYCVNDSIYKENLISHEIIEATIQDPQFKDNAKEYPELERYTEIKLNEEINSFITSMKTLQKNEVNKSDYEKINQWTNYLLKINTHQKEEKIKLSNTQSTLHNNLAKSLCEFFESNNNDNEFFKDSFEKFFSLTLEFYPRFAVNLVVNPNLKFYFKNFNPEDIKEEFKNQFAIACAEKADDFKILKSYADKIWHNLRGVSFLQGCAKINNVFCQNKVQEGAFLFWETKFHPDALNLFDTCIENLYDENSNKFREGNKIIINTAYKNFSSKDNETKLKLSNAFDKVQNAYSKAGFILPLDVKDEASNQCAIELFDPLFNCLVRSHGKTTDSSKNIEKLLNISKKFEELQPFYDQSAEILRLDKTNDWSSVLSNLANDQQEIQKNKQNILSLTGTS